MMDKNTVDESKTTTEVDVILGEIEDASRRMRECNKRGMRVESLYRGDGDDVNVDMDRFKILWSITEMQRPLVYDALPRPVCRPEHNKNDDVARVAAEMLERAVTYYQECPGHEFQYAMCRARDDFLLPGRGTVRVVYDATVEDDPQKIPLSQEELAEAEAPEMDESGTAYRWSGQGDEQHRMKKTYERVYLEHVNWRDFLHSDGRCWEEVWWVAFGEWLSREDLIEQFGEDIGMRVPLMKDLEDERERRRYQKADLDTYRDCARVWEFWSKRTGKVYKVAENFHEDLEEPMDDPLGLQLFFPCPRPVYMIEQTSNLDFVPEYKMYEDQAKELNTLTGRIDRLTDMVAVRGVYDAALKDSMQKLLGGYETKLYPSENWAQVMAQAGGKFDNAIGWLPIGNIADVLAKLLVQRDKNLELIYQIVGLSDILRGQTQPREAGKTQQMKMLATTGKRSRIGVKNKKMERLARDAMRLMAEVVAEHFSPQTLMLVTGMQPEDLGEVDPQDAIALLQDEGSRDFAIDVESDSTIAPDEIKEQDEMQTFFGSLSMLVTAISGAVQGGALPEEAGKQMILWAVRRFPAGRDLEPILEAAAKAPPKDPSQDPEAQAKMMETQIKMMKLQMDQKELEADLMFRSAELQLEAAKLEQDGEIETAKIMQKRAEALMNYKTALVNVSGGNVKK